MRSCVALLIGAMCLFPACLGPTIREPESPVGRIDLMHRVPEAWPYRLDSIPVSSALGMVATDAPLATSVGIEVLRMGGNSIDAAIATAFALAVVLPGAGNIGGGGFLVAWFSDGKTAALDFREKAPAASTRDMYLDANGKETMQSITGHLAAGVPGSVAGPWEAHRKYGSVPWRELVEPAIRLASQGFMVDERFSESVRDDSSRLAQSPASAALFLPGGKPLQTGTLWRNPDLASTLERIAELGPPGFYEGETARLIDAEMRSGGGIITADDLSGYEPVWRTPIEFTYRGFYAISMPPPSSGGIALALIANILEGYDLRSMQWQSVDVLHLMAEAMRRAFAERNCSLGDPGYVSIPAAKLISKDYARQLRATIRRDHATLSSDIRPESPGEGESMHTTHFSVVDAAGNAVALTTTINHGYGSAVTVAGAGFLLNNEMDDFAAKPGSPNAFGLVQGDANSIAPGKRVLSSMSPTIVLGRDRKPLLITGASGGPRIITAVFQILSNVVDFGFDISAAVSAPRIHHQHLPDKILCEENGFSPAVLTALRALGHTVEPSTHMGIAASILRINGTWHAVADPRSGGSAAGE